MVFYSSEDFKCNPFKQIVIHFYPTSVNISHSVKVNHVGHKGTTTTKIFKKMLAQIKVVIKKDQRGTRTETLKSLMICVRLNIEGPRRPSHRAKHKGPILRSQHKQNGHKSSSVALTYRFSHFADFPALRIIMWPRALMGINRLGHPACLSPSLWNMIPCFISCRGC